MKDYMLDAAVVLRRNYADLPFDAMNSEETARRVNERAMVALERSGESYAYLPLSSLPADRREELEKCRLLSPDDRDAVSGAAYLRMDEKACVETSGEDHLLIAAYDESGNAEECLATAEAIAQSLEDTGRMARNDQYGFLTAKPCDAGTGQRVSIRLNMPMTTLARQIPAAVKVAGASGMTLRSVGGGIGLLENRLTMGMSGKELAAKTVECARKLCALERTLRWRAKERKDINIADKAWRSYATARFALRMSKNEALQLWSGMTLGMSVGDMPYSEETLDRMWHIVQMPQGKLMQDSNLQPEVERARRIRAVFSGGE